MHVDLIELCAGTGAVSWAALGPHRFPVSRIGAKWGWRRPILEALGVEGVRSALLVERSPRLAALLAALTSPTERAGIAQDVEAVLHKPAREVWEAARTGASPGATLLWLAGARGGVGGFKGGHVRRPSVDGFIPSRASLLKRVSAFRGDGALVLCADAAEIDPHAYAPTAIYIDPPYVGRQGYEAVFAAPVEVIAERWARAGHRVVVSEARPIDGASWSREITSLREGQSRRSLTTNPSEWISVWNAQ